ncbi:MAG: hypothetical protein JXA33_24660, partial [Anaerolineae bacterium]|nr:hypothetical protein [Anaerolineae bacterium]
ALAWLESLTVGKEEELRAQAEVEAQARVDEILGRKREAVPVEPEVAPPSELESKPSIAPDGRISGTSALQWLESFTIGKEEELRSQAEAEAQARVDELLWRKREEVPVEPEAAPTFEEKIEETEEIANVGIFGWSAFGEKVVELEVKPQVVEPPFTKAQELPAEPEFVSVTEGEGISISGFFGWLKFEQKVVEVIAESQPLPAVPSRPTSPRPSEVASVIPEPELVLPELEPVEEIFAPEPESILESEVAAESIVPEHEAVTEVVVPESATEPVVTKPETPPTFAMKELDLVESDLADLYAQVTQEKDDYFAHLALARALWNQGDVKTSMTHYTRLIEASELTDDVINDLNQYAAQVQPNIYLLRALGDVYMKEGMINKALETYNQAMHLL